MAVPTAYAPVAHSATPHSVMITVVGGVGATLILSGTLLSYLAEGPLKAYLRKLPVLNWDTLNITGVHGEKVRIYDVALSLAATPEYRVAAFDITWIGNADPTQAGLSVNLAASPPESGGFAVRTMEIRFNHSDPA